MSHTKFALVGCGRIGQRHLEHIVNTGVLVAICDIDESRLLEACRKYAVPGFASLEAMLEAGLTIDVLSVCTPNGLHSKHTLLGLQAGCHVLCEKPMALTIEDGEAMIAAAEHAGRHLFVIKQNRYNPPVEALRKLIREDKLGKILGVQVNCFWNRNPDYYHNSWKGTKSLDGGTLFTQFSHFVDLMLWLAGDVEAVDAFCANLNHEGIIEFEDSGVVMLRFCNGALGTLHYTVNAFGKNMEGSITIFGEKGTVKVGGEYLNEMEYQQIASGAVQNIPMGNKPNNYGTYTGSMSNHHLVYQNVLDVLQRNGPIMVQAREALATVELINRIYTAAACHAKNQMHHA